MCSSGCRDYVRAAEHFELAGRAAQRAGDSFGVSGGLYNAPCPRGVDPRKGDRLGPVRDHGVEGAPVAMAHMYEEAVGRIR